MSTKKPSYDELKRRLAKTEALVTKLQKIEGKAKPKPKRTAALLDTKEYLEAYKASEQNFKNLIDASPLGVRIVTTEGDLIYANQAILDICGYKTALEMAAVPRSKLYTPESYEAHQERKKKRKLNEHVPSEYEISIQRPDGEFRNLQVFRREVTWGGERQFMALYQDITERKRAEEALRESEARFHTIVEKSNDGIVFIQNGIVQYCNSKLLEMGSYAEADILGKPFINFVAPDDKDKVLDIYRKRLAGQKVPNKYELNLLVKDGRIINTEISASLVTTKQELIDIAVVRDITERKKVEQTLEDEATRRRILIEQSSDGIVILDQDGAVYEANQRFADMLGYTMKEMKQLHVFDWEYQYPKEQVVEMIRTVDEKGDHIKTRHRRKDGTTYDVEISTNGAMFGGQKLVFCVCRDITERKKAEEALKASEERFKEAQALGKIGSWYFDIEKQTITWSEETYALYERDPKDGPPSIEEEASYYTPEQVKLLRDNFTKAAKTKQTLSCDLEVKLPSRRKAYYHSIMKPVQDAQGKVVKLSGTIQDITERKRMEQAVQESEEKFSKAFNNSPEMMVIVNVAEDRYVEVNDSFAKNLGYSREELIGHAAAEFNLWIYPEEKEKMDRLIQEQGKLRDEEFRFRTKNGDTHTWLCSADTLDIGGVRCMLGTSTDITERRKAQEALRESQERFSRAFHISPAIIAITTIKEGRYVDVNDSYTQATGYSREELIGKETRSINIWADPKDRIRMFRILQEKGRIDKEEFSFRMKSGEIRTWLFSAQLITIGGEECIIGVSVDITERKQIEEALKVSEERFRQIFQQGPLGIMLSALDHHIEFVNPQFCKMLGYTEQELRSMDYRDYTFPEDVQIDEPNLEKLVKGELDYYSREKRTIKKNKEIMWESLTVTLLRDKSGNPLGFLAMIEDITQRKSAEETIAGEAIRRRILVEQSRDGIVILDQDGNVFEANQRFAEMLGYTMEEMKQLHVFDWEYQYPKEQVVEMIRTVDEKGDHFETRHRRKDGTTYDVEISTNGAIFGGQKLIFCVCRDITERKRMEQAIRESEEKFSKAFVSSPAIVAITTINDGRFVEVNDTYLQTTGNTREEVIGKNSVQLNAWADPQERRRMLRILKEQGRVSKEEFRFRMKSGEIRTWLFSAEPITFGGEECLIGVSVDITERKRTEEDLEREREDIKLVMDTSRALIWYKDINGKFLRVNRAFAEALNMSEKDFMGKTVFDIYSKDIAQSMTNDDREVLVSGSPKLNIIEQYESAAGLRWVQTDKVPVLDKNGKPVAIIGFAQDITERKQAEDTIKESEEKFNTAFHASLNLMAIITRGEGRIIDANEAFCHSTGYKSKELIGHSVLELNLWNNPEQRSDFNQTIATKGRLENKEILLRTKTGEIRTFLFSAKPVTLRGVACMVIAALDISERKQAEEAIKESEERFRTLFETMAQGVIYHDAEGRVISANLAAQQILGLTLEEMIGKTSLDPKRKRLREDGSEFPSEEHPSIVALRTGKPVNNVIMAVYNPVDKNYRWILNSAIPEFRRGEKKPYRVYTTFTDITGRKQAEERINYLNQTLRSIRNINQLITREKNQDKLLQGVCDTLVESRSFYMAWIALFDESHHLITYAHSGIPGDFSPIVDGIKKGNLPPCVEKALKKNQVIVIEDPKKCVGCQMYERSLNYGAMAIRLEYAGNVYGVLCASLPKEILADKSEVSLFQEIANDVSFALYNMDLQFEYERLEQERLRSAKLESIGTLAGGIAHDFNNLLTGIMGNIGLVKTNIGPTEAAYEMLEEAEKAALRARDLTQQLLTFARGGKPIKKPVHIADIIKESATFALRGSKAKLELSLPNDLWPIEADEGQISQVINNLVLNADEAMPSGGTLKINAENVTLKSAAIQLLPGGNYVRINIADMGIGMSAEHLERIFEPYFTTKQRGSGLGLTSAYSIVRNHGGIILADSILNKGSTFHVYLPATKKPLTKGGKKMTTETAGQAGGKILVMDDEEIIRKMLKNMLSLAGYTVELTSDGAEALKKYQQARKEGDPFSAVIMDLTIPGGMGGKEMVQKLLEMDPNATAIVSSGYATDPIMSDYKAYGFKAVIAKPYSSKQLQETLSGLLARKKK